MRVKKEVVVLLAALGLLGWLLSRRLSETSARLGTSRGAEPPEFVDQPAPNPALVETAERDPASWDRDPFSEPSDTRPLPPLALESPPLPPLEGLLPPPVPGPAPRVFGRFLRRPATVVPVRGLFGTAEENGEDEAGSDEASALEPLQGLGYVGARPTNPGPERFKDLSAEEREERIASWRRLYDWIKINQVETLYGRIQNEEPFALAERPDEPVQFLEVDPATGLDRYPGQGPVTYPRERVSDLALADTVANQIDSWRHAIGDRVTPGQYPEVLEFARYCVTKRLEAPRALEVAEEVYGLLIEQYPDDPAPRLGRARAYESEFRLEDAYGEYLALLERFPHRAEVHVALAELESRLRLFDSAAERLAEAERIERASWRVQQALSRFHAQHGDWVQALEHAELTHRFEPSASFRAERSAIRNDLGAARLATGDPAGAAEVFRQVLAVDPESQLALAGLHATYVCDASFPVDGLGSAVPEDEFGQELLLALALESMAYGTLDLEEARKARAALETAAEMDPVRASEAWRALSWLAEVTGYPEETAQYAELAFEADPTDAWTLYQRGRVLAARDDADGAVEAFLSALAEESDFEDALVALGALAQDRGDHEAADRYYERALALDPERAIVHARRGLNYLEENELGLARGEFERALERDPEDPVARTGLAWVAYRSNDPDRARQLYAEVDDLRRNLAEDDPYRLYARGQMTRIEEHLDKVLWTDRFERRFLRNGWHPEEMKSPTMDLVDGQLVLRGPFERDGRVRAFRTLAAPSFVSLEAELVVGAENNARVGIFVAKERQVRGGGSEATSEVAIGRHRDGPVQIKVHDSSSSDAAWVDLTFPEWPVGRPVRIKIEREGSGSSTTGRLVVDDFTVLQGAPMRSLFASTSDLRFGVFAEGSSGRQVDVAVNIVEVVHTLR